MILTGIYRRVPTSQGRSIRKRRSALAKLQPVLLLLDVPDMGDELIVRVTHWEMAPQLKGKVTTMIIDRDSQAVSIVISLIPGGISASSHRFHSFKLRTVDYAL
jgi:hypothetical protein